MEARGAGAAGRGRSLARSVSAAAGPGAGAARARREEKGRGGKRRRRGAGRLLPEQRVPRARRSSPPSHCPRRGCRGRRAELGRPLPAAGPAPRSGRRWRRSRCAARGWGRPGRWRRRGMLGRSGGGASAARGTLVAAPGRPGRRRSWCRGRGEGKLREPMRGPVRLGPPRPATWGWPGGERRERPGRPSAAGVWLASRRDGRGWGPQTWSGGRMWGCSPEARDPQLAAPVAYPRVVSAMAPGRKACGGVGSLPGGERPPLGLPRGSRPVSCSGDASLTFRMGDAAC
ncbi:uncharacterized protein ACIB01_011366 [Guaruba guarouba]